MFLKKMGGKLNVEMFCKTGYGCPNGGMAGQIYPEHKCTEIALYA